MEPEITDSVEEPEVVPESPTLDPTPTEGADDVEESETAESAAAPDVVKSEPLGPAEESKAVAESETLEPP